MLVRHKTYNIQLTIICVNVSVCQTFTGRHRERHRTHRKRTKTPPSKHSIKEHFTDHPAITKKTKQTEAEKAKQEEKNTRRKKSKTNTAWTTKNEKRLAHSMIKKNTLTVNWALNMTKAIQQKRHVYSPTFYVIGKLEFIYNNNNFESL